jgi:hypothetical protein
VTFPRTTVENFPENHYRKHITIKKAIGCPPPRFVACSRQNVAIVNGMARHRHAFSHFATFAVHPLNLTMELVLMNKNNHLSFSL